MTLVDILNSMLLVPFNIIHLIQGGKVRVVYEMTKYFGRIKIIEAMTVHIKFDKKFVEEYKCTNNVKIEFIFNRMSFVCMHN